MDVEQIVTESDFVTFVCQLSESAATYPRTLEDYLRALLGAVMAHERDAPTARLIAQILSDGLTMPPLPFDPAWLEYTNPPDTVLQGSWDAANEFAAALHMLRYQIADLHRMAAAGALDNPHRRFGIDSPTQHRWYNFDPQSFLNGASDAQSGGQQRAERSWGDLALMLWLGQIYE